MVLTDPALNAHVGETRAMNELVRAFMPQVPSFATMEGLTALRSETGIFAPQVAGEAGEREIAGPAGPLHLRAIVPDRVDAVYLDIHGGGWCIGSSAADGNVNAEIARQAGVTVVGVDYRLAPEHPWPACAEDCEAAALWLLHHAKAEWGTDSLLIGGGSAGAHLAVTTLLRLRDRHGPDAAQKFRGANLVFGCYDLGLTPSARTSQDSLVIPRPTLDACCDHLLPGLDAEARRDPEYSPLYADLSGMPAALFSVGTLDPVLDDTLFMAARWEAAGAEAELAVYPESVHGFVAFPTAMAVAARARIATWMKAVIAHCHTGT